MLTADYMYRKQLNKKVFRIKSLFGYLYRSRSYSVTFGWQVKFGCGRVFLWSFLRTFFAINFSFQILSTFHTGNFYLNTMIQGVERRGWPFR